MSTNVQKEESYECKCGATLTVKHKSLKRHLLTQKHIKGIELTCPPHHWTIDTATGPKSKGVCVKCDTIKNFDNSIQYAWSWHTNAVEKEAQEKIELDELEHQLNAE